MMIMMILVEIIWKDKEYPFWLWLREKMLILKKREIEKSSYNYKKIKYSSAYMTSTQGPHKTCVTQIATERQFLHINTNVQDYNFKIKMPRIIQV